MPQNNLSAFPHPNFNGLASNGLTLRDYFAAKAMQGILDSFKGHKSVVFDGKELDLSEASYYIADAMLQQREKE